MFQGSAEIGAGLAWGCHRPALGLVQDCRGRVTGEGVWPKRTASSQHSHNQTHGGNQFAKPDSRQTEQDSHVRQSRQTKPRYLSASQSFPQRAEPDCKALEALGITTRSYKVDFKAFSVPWETASSSHDRKQRDCQLFKLASSSMSSPGMQMPCTREDMSSPGRLHCLKCEPCPVEL